MNQLYLFIIIIYRYINSTDQQHMTERISLQIR